MMKGYWPGREHHLELKFPPPPKAPHLKEMTNLVKIPRRNWTKDKILFLFIIPLFLYIYLLPLMPLMEPNETAIIIEQSGVKPLNRTSKNWKWTATRGWSGEKWLVTKSLKSTIDFVFQFLLNSCWNWNDRFTQEEMAWGLYHSCWMKGHPH